MENNININLESNIKEKISLFPFHGKSKYLIDKLYIIGYDNSTIYNYLIKNEKSKDIIIYNDKNKYPYKKLYSTILPNSKEVLSPSDCITELSIPEKPSLINEFTNDYNKKVLDMDITLDMIFPNKPILYSVKVLKRNYSICQKSDSKYNKLKKEIRVQINDDIKEIMKNKSYFVVFSSNPQIDTKNKKSINGFCYISYCKFKGQKIINNYYHIYYIPIGICFISEYPYYNSYYKLAEQIFYLFRSRKIEVPIEIMLYNLVNSTFSPINGDILLCIEPLSFSLNITESNSNSLNNKKEKKIENDNNNENNKLEKEITPFNLNNKDKDKDNNDNNNNKEENNISNSSKILIHIEKNIQNDFNTINSLKKESVIKNENLETLLETYEQYNPNNLFEQIKFPYLQGYPLLQYNLPKILFTKFSIPDLIFIFINSFLENNILIFSDDIQLLSLVINSFHNFNFPLNDNNYYNINACVSYNNYINGNCKYISKVMNSIIGINSSFQLDNLNNNKNILNEQIIYDLDSNEMYIIDENISMFYEYIKTILKVKEDKDYKDSLLFYEIKRLSDTLGIIKEKSKTIKWQSQSNNVYLLYNQNINIEIQEAFYTFIVNILIYYYSQLIYHINSDSNQNNNINDDNVKIIIEFNPYYQLESNIKYKNTKEEDYFFDEFKNTFKFSIFFNNFINNHESLDLYCIPYLFLEEYISFLSRTNKSSILNNYNFNFFKIFQNFYNKKQSQKIHIDFNPFLSEYFKKYKNIIERDIKDFNNDGEYTINYNELKKALNYQWYELDNNLLLKYIILIKSLTLEEYGRLFNINAIFDDNLSKNINIYEIEDEFEKEIFENNYKENGLLINDDDICCMNIIILIAISLKYIDINNDITIILGYLFKEFFILRKYYYILMDIIYKLLKYELNDNNSSKLNNRIKKIDDLLTLYYTCVNSFREKNIIPNEKIINVIINMNQIGHNIRNNKNINLNNINNNKLNNDLKENNNKKKNKIDKNNFMIFVLHNFNHDHIISEQNIIKYVNKIDKDNNNSWKKRAELIINVRNEEKIITLIPQIKYICKYYNKNEVYNLSFKSEIFSQRKIKDTLNEEYHKFNNNNLDFKALDIRNIIFCLLNIFIYIRNSNKYKEISEISEAFKIILYYFITATVQ